MVELLGIAKFPVDHPEFGRIIAGEGLIAQMEEHNLAATLLVGVHDGMSLSLWPDSLTC